MDILLVEDSPQDAELVREALQASGVGFDLQRVGRREEFERQLAQRRPDVIVSDHGLHSFDSLAALALARAKAPDIPFILVMGLPDAVATEALKRGADAEVPKEQLSLLGPTVNRLMAVAARCAQLERRARDAEAKYQALAQSVAERTRELEQTNRQLETFNYSVSHDLRGPLRHIDGFISLLQQRAGAQLSPACQGYAQAIAQAARHMGVLLDALLAFARLGRQELRRVPVSLETLVREAMAQLRPEVVGRAIDWEIGLLPVVQADPVMLRQVWINLLGNALKYTRTRPRAHIQVGCTSADDHVVCFVRDNGVGFDPQYAAKLFGVFQRLHSPQEFEGTGIGLALVRRIVQRHGGRTWAEGAPDQGATFYVSLPVGVQP